MKFGNQTRTTDYVGNMIYENGSLKSILVDGDYIENNKYYFFIQDHLGNNRAVAHADGTVIQTNHYYPYGMTFTEDNTGNAKAQPYKYSGKEFDGERGLNVYDYSARYMDPTIGRFTSIDPVTEKYSSISPYTYCANNPARYIDPTGMIIEDPDELVKNQKARLNQTLSYIQNALKGKGLSVGMTAALNNLAGAFKSSLNEISTLEKSDQVYFVHYGEGKDGGMSYDNKTGAINIGIGKSDASIGLIGYELKHAYQFEKGQTSLVIDNSEYGKLYDITDETAAYNRERTFGTGIVFFQTPNAVVNGYPLQMNDNDVRSFGNSMTPPAYQNLPNGPIDINSKEGKALRQQTVDAGRAGTPVKEIYKGWKNDYLKGQKN